MNAQFVAAAAKSYPMDKLCMEIEKAAHKYLETNADKDFQHLMLCCTMLCIKKSTEKMSMPETFDFVQKMIAAQKFFDVKPN